LYHENQSISKNIKFVREAIEVNEDENKLNHKNLLNELGGIKRSSGNISGSEAHSNSGSIVSHRAGNTFAKVEKISRHV
jgi:hypothetical protein